MKNNHLLLLLLICLSTTNISSQTKSETVLAATPPMGWMTWNLYGTNINEKIIRDIADAMVLEGFKDAGYTYIYIDDGWQGGRDKRNNMIPDPEKFPSGIKALADYVHSKGLKLGIYSDAAQLTCAGYTASLGFEEQDAKTFAEWGIDYLKYDFCYAPDDVETAKVRYAKMADALRNCGRDIVLGICEWGGRKPWTWASKCGGQLWRTTPDVRDIWKAPKGNDGGVGILDIINENKDLYQYASVGAWNDMDMLVVGLNGKGGPSSLGGRPDCKTHEYVTQMSMWCMMASPLAMTNDLTNVDETTKEILLNKDIIAINQDKLGIQAKPIICEEDYQVYLKPLENEEYAVAVLNVSEKSVSVTVDLKSLPGKYRVYDVWTHKKVASKATKIKTKLEPHQTKVYRLTK